MTLHGGEVEPDAIANLLAVTPMLNVAENGAPTGELSVSAAHPSSPA